MKKLELLGLQNDGKHLTLNDAEGKRYSLEITSELRALLRHDVTYQNNKEGAARPVTPREIQAYVRAGKTVEEISELTSTPPSHIESLAHPIINERNYTARLARSLPTTRDPGSLTLEELVATRLASRGVKNEDIEWDAIRESGEPWTIIARYESAERERKAVWHVDLAKRSLEALSEEAMWLSETPLLPHGKAWRAPNTPPIQTDDSTQKPAPPLSSLPSTSSTPSPSNPDTSSDGTTASVSRIDAVLADLDSRRGIPTDKEHYSSMIEASAASALESANSPDYNSSQTSEHSSGQPRKDNNRETIFDLPVHPNSGGSSGKASENANTGSGNGGDSSAHDNNDKPTSSEVIDNLCSSAAPDETTSTTENTKEKTQTQKKVRRSDRPSMPTWDEIVFGKKD